LIFQLTSEDENLQEVLCQSARDNLKNNFAVAAKLLQNLLSCAGSVRIIVDGVDEIDEVERGKLLRQLADLSESRQETHILISSRAEDDIAKILGPVSTTIRVDSRNSGSIQAFIDRWSRGWFATHDFAPEDKAEIVRLLAPLSSKAEGKPSSLFGNYTLKPPAYLLAGMFLYAQIMLGSIDLLHDVEDIRRELRVLPENLDEAYGDPVISVT